MKSILSKYKAEYKSIRTKGEYAFGLAQRFVAKLLALPPNERYELLPLFRQIENDAFNDGFELPNLKYDELEKEKAAWESASKTITKRREVKSNLADDFNKVLFHFFSKYDLALNRVKGYFLFRADNADNSPTKVRILYDDEFNKHPEINSFDIQEGEYDLKKFHLKEFSELVAKENKVQNQNYLYIFLVTSHLRDNQNLIEIIKSILNYFSSCSYIAIKKKPIESSIDFDFRRIEDGYRAIEYFSGKVFNNRDISFEEECILKTLFPGNEMILDYKILKKGNSGSKVIEIQPLKVDSPSMSRFVAKYSAIDGERKILDERDKFNLWVRNYGVDGYSAEYYHTDTHEAIMYHYASADRITDSFPFSKLIGEAIKGEYHFPYSLENVIDDLFECSPFKKWNTNPFQVTETVRALYNGYLHSEAKIYKAISLIKGIKDTAINSDELVVNYRRIKEYSLKTMKKICHGDLHSENFFKDEQGVYLIDFGWTNQHHSLIDHATLECSLKFKHLPFYIPLDDLKSCETELLSINSLSKLFDLSFIKRPSVLEIAKLIIQIRENAKEHMLNKTSPLEYLISLFIISFRQIQYPDLNQAYALASAEVLSKKIVELIEE